jgi:acetyl esterase/lipase
LNTLISIRVFYPSTGEQKRKSGDAAALIYFYGGGYTIGTVDEFENGLRVLAEESGAQVYAVEYRLAPEWRFPIQLHEYIAVVEWLQGEGGKERGIDKEKVMGGGDSAGGNMTAAVSLRLRDEGKKSLRAQVLLYPEARLPFDTKAAEENNSGFYLECKFLFHLRRILIDDKYRQRYFLLRRPLSTPRHTSRTPIRLSRHAVNRKL